MEDPLLDAPRKPHRHRPTRTINTHMVDHHRITEAVQDDSVYGPHHNDKADRDLGKRAEHSPDRQPPDKVAVQTTTSLMEIENIVKVC